MKKLLFILPLLLVGLLWSCSDDNVLSKSEMEDILYDIHVSQPLADYSLNGCGAAELTYRTAILKKYGITQAEWDSSFTYYACHTNDLYDIYTSLQERLERDVSLAGGSISQIDNEFAGGDTTDVWNQKHSFVLMPYDSYNVRSFHIDADSSFHAGDKFVIRYHLDFLINAGMRDVVLVTALQLANDSVVTQVTHKSQSDDAEVSFADTDRKGIKSIKGYFMLPRNIDDNNDAYRVVAVDGIRLIRLHTDDKEYREKLRNDSIAKARQDSVNSQQQSLGESQETSEQPSDESNTLIFNKPTSPHRKP